MSARRVSDKPLALPANPHYIEFERSDGDSRTWPTNTEPVLDEEGSLNFMERLGPENPSTVRWRLQVAQGLAIALKLPANPNYILKDWPAGYAFYDHNKGKPGSQRHDLYLFGSTKRRYRSVNEFIPHAIWLIQDPTLNMANCLCKYCQKVPQREVTASLPGILRPQHGTQSPSPRNRPPREKTRSMREAVLKSQRDARVYVAVQKAPLPILPKSGNVHPKHTMLVERNSDLRAVHSKTEMKLKRWFRTGELLWCALNPPIMSAKENVAIQFWPGIVDEVKLKTNPVPYQKDPTSIPEDGKEDPNTPSWSVVQSTVYRIQLLGVSHSILVADYQVLPYQAHIPPNDLITELQAFPPANLNFSKENISKFNPCPEGKPAGFQDAIAPYAMAVQIASTLSTFWCLTDEWSFEYSLPPLKPPAAPSDPSSSTGDTSLQVAIDAATAHNFSISTAGPSNSNHYPNVPGPSSDTSGPDGQRVSTRMLGKGQTATQMRFQGVWWGAERVWTDDFVRLKVPRRCIAPNGAENILPPSGPGKSAYDIFAKAGEDPAKLGAGSRGVFMRLDALFVVDTFQGDGMAPKKECRASGMLYELADIDWDDPNAPKNPTDTNSTDASLPNPPPMTFMPAPSPLNPHILPQTDPPAVIDLTLTSLPAPVPPTTSSSPPPNTLMSHPLGPYYNVPQAPEGYVFRPLLPDGHEIVISLSLLSGRYYPRILSHPLLENVLQDAMSNPREQGGLLESNNLWALEGLSAGFFNSVDPTIYKGSRLKMVEDADKVATKELEAHKQQRMMEMDQSPDNSQPFDIDLTYPDGTGMDVD